VFGSRRGEFSLCDGIPGRIGYKSQSAELQLKTTNPTTMKKQIVRISIIQSSKIVTLLYTLLGFIYTLIGIPLAIFATTPQMQIIGIVYCFGPVFMAVLGFIFFVIGAAIYNLLASRVGGFEFEVKDVG
jgi:hypothetical protein